MLYYLDELMTAMDATTKRRWLNIASAVVTVLILVALTIVGAPTLIVVAFIIADCAAQAALVAHWARRDALAAHRQTEFERQ